MPLRTTNWLKDQIPINFFCLQHEPCSAIHESILSKEELQLLQRGNPDHPYWYVDPPVGEVPGTVTLLCARGAEVGCGGRVGVASLQLEVRA